MSSPTWNRNMKKRKGFTYVDTIISILIVAILAVGIINATILKNKTYKKICNDDILTSVMINVVEGLKEKLSEGEDISDFAALEEFGGYDDIEGNIYIKKDYVLFNSVVYIVQFDISSKSSKLNEAVVLYANE